jgi:hypothetical protein
MQFDKTFSIGVECVCGAKLDAVLVDSREYDFSIVIDNTHICPAAQHQMHPTTGMRPSNNRLSTPDFSSTSQEDTAPSSGG